MHFTLKEKRPKGIALGSEDKRISFKSTGRLS
jgi:hypothetical protein